MDCDRFKNKKIFVTGVCGTVGSELIRLLLQDPQYEVEEVVGLDSNESELFFIEQRYIRSRFKHEVCRWIVTIPSIQPIFFYKRVEVMLK